MNLARSNVTNIHCPAAHLVTVLTLMLTMVASVSVTVATPAAAAVSAGVPAATSLTALTVTASKRGSAYQYGAVGPTRFDCSGLTMWAYARAGRALPRTTSQQYAATIRVSRANARPGDLVFFMGGGRPYHVGVYAGAGRLWHAPKAGDRVRLATIWTTAVAYGRVR